jgi:peroxiredoxin
MIGIANDEIKNLKKFIDENDVSWDQIVQSDDKNIIADFGVVGYPTTFLIDINGVIIAKNLRAIELSEKLSELFNK